MVISSFEAGGAERVMSIMANYWTAKEWVITLVTFDDGSVPPFYKLDRRVNHITLGITGYSNNIIKGFWSNIRRIVKLRRAIIGSEPEAVISFIDRTNVTTLLAVTGSGVPVLISERSDPAQFSIGRCWEMLRKFTYRFANRIITQNEKARSYFPGKLQSKTIIIPNPIVVEYDDEHIADVRKNRTIISMGRLSGEKRFDFLINAFSKLKARFPDWNLMIIGEGVERGNLEKLINELGMSTRAKLLGNIKNPHNIIKRADIYVLSSKYEGFPNALCEAMACGLPVISTEYHSCVKDIVIDGENGILTPPDNVDALAFAMEQLMSDSNRRARLASKAREIKTKYGAEKIMGIWEEVLESVS